MKDFFLKMFSVNDGTSSKRGLGAIGMISMVVFMFLHPENKLVVDTVGYVTIAYGLGTVVEKFAPRKSSEE